MARPDDFSLRALFDALDQRRRERELSWAAVAAEMNGGQQRPRSLSATTISGVGRRTAAEGDGVLQMLLWLGRSPESFVPGLAAGDRHLLRSPGPGRVLRWDTKGLFSALDAERRHRQLTWASAARDVGLTPGMMRALAKGGRTSVPAVMRLVRWLGRPASEFTHATDR